MANTVDTFSTERSVPERRPLNLRSYREPDTRIMPSMTASSMSTKKMLLIAAPVAVAAGVLAWRVKRVRPLLSSLAMSGVAWAANNWRVARAQRTHDTQIDDAIDQSFPASDPPAIGH